MAFLLLLAGGARGEDEATALARDTETLLAELDAEIVLRREGGRGAAAEALAVEVDALRRRAAGAGQPAASTVPEVHLVRLRDRRGLRGIDRKRSLRLTVTGRPVILLFAGADTAWWEVEVANGAEVRRVLKAGAEQTIRGVRMRAESVSGVGLLENTDLGDLRNLVESRAGARLATVLDGGAGEGEALVVGPGNPEWQAQHVHMDALDLYWRSTRARRAAQREALKKERFFSLYRWREENDLRVSVGDWTPLGPLLARQRRLPDVLAIASTAVKDDVRDEVYLLRAGVLIRYALPKGPPEVLRVPDTLPQVREPCALAIDTLRHRLLLATKHDLGYLYALDLATREWSVVNDLDDVDTAGMAYDALRDAVLCIEFGEGGALVVQRFSPVEGRRLPGTPLRLPPPGEPRPLVAACSGGRLMLLYPPAEERAYRLGADARAFVIEPSTGEVLFATRVRPWEDFEPLGEPALESLWNELLLEDEMRAGRAMRALAGQGDATVGFLAKRFTPQPGAAENLGRWVEMLSDDEALVRDLAQHRLVEAGSEAEEFLAGLDLAAFPPETRRRVGAALKAVAGPGRLQRGVRAVRVLEWIETPLAEALLRDLAMKGGDERRASAARDALVRIEGPRR